MKFPARSLLWCVTFWAALAPAQDVAVTPERLQQLLQRFPDADTNQDGVLSEQEARAYAAKRGAKQTKQAKRAAAA